MQDSVNVTALALLGAIGVEGNPVHSNIQCGGTVRRGCVMMDERGQRRMVTERFLTPAGRS